MESQFFYQYILMIKDKITDNPSKANILESNNIND